MERSFARNIWIEAPIEQVFAYATDPKRWHEWYPSSAPTSADCPARAVGDQFRIVTTQPAPLPLLPNIASEIAYTVTDIDEPRLWSVLGNSNKVRTWTTYEFADGTDGTHFLRTFRYAPKGALVGALTVALWPGIVRAAEQGLARLKERLESPGVGGSEV